MINPSVHHKHLPASSSIHVLPRTFLPAILAMAFATPLPLLAHEQRANGDQEAKKENHINETVTLPAVTVTTTSPTSVTERTTSYTTDETTAATRLPLSLRATPQSVTVVTRQRMDDQALHSVQAALENTTGISSSTLDSERISFYSRGFSIDSFQYDGIPTTFINGASLQDTAFYDRIEVVRGATGLLTGSGNPGASVNLVRKRPTRAFSASTSLSAGSWNNYRGMADVSVPLTQDGNIRARLIGVYQDRDSHLDLYQQEKKALYGIIDADLTSNTTLSLGFDYQDITPRGTTWGGVPAWFSNGMRTDWPRSKTLATQWSRWDNTIKTAFINLEHRLANDWTLRAAFNQQRSDVDARLFSGLGYPDRATGRGLTPVALASHSETRQNSFDAIASGPFDLLGRKHELVVGLMGSRRESDDYSTGFVFPATPISNFYNWTGNYPEPNFDKSGYTLTRATTKQSGLYSVARFSLADPLKLIIGGRVSNYEVVQNSSRTQFRYKKSNEFTPYAGLIYDLNNTYSAYASYTEIFNPQTYRDRNNQVLKPMVGKNTEIGLKGEYLNRRLNASLSLFETRLDNVAQSDTGQLLPDGTQAYYGASGTKSRGVDFDLQGKLAHGWNIYAGLSHFNASNADGTRLSSRLPRTTARTFMTYQLPGAWNKLMLGGGLTWQSRFYQSATSPYGKTIVEQRPYTLASFMARYALTDRSTLSMHIDNVFDKKYTVMNGFYNQILYGEPRRFTLTFGYKL